MKRKGMRPGIVSQLLNHKTALGLEFQKPPGSIYHRWLCDKSNAPATGLASVHRGMLAHNQGLEPKHGYELMQKWLLSLKVSENIAVSRDLCELVRVAGEDLPEEYIAERHHLFSDHGFAWMETPIQDEIHTRPINALSWHHGQGLSDRDTDEPVLIPGIEINLWSAALDLPGILLPAGADFLPYGKPSYGWVLDGQREQRSGLLSKLSRATRFVLTMQMFLADELPAAERHRAPKSMAPQMRALGWPDPSVTVIDLRRRATPRLFANEAEDAAWHLQYRHVVRGHWAKRYVGPTHPRHSGEGDQKETVYVYISPYIKGPEDAPFIMSEKVNLLRR